MRLPFIKMQGLGNDFIVIDGLDGSAAELTPDQARKLCDRRLGIGADQILHLKKPRAKGLDARMEILNADGSTAEMCGNGIRAVALFLHKKHPKPAYDIETLAGIKHVKIHGDQVAVDMGSPAIGAVAGEELQILGQSVHFHEISMGNPHAVIFENRPVEKFGPEIEKHSRFPKRTNVEFVIVQSPSQIDVKVWERGAGITLACGTGACASAVAAIATGRAKSPLTVKLPGGELKIEWAGAGKPVIMTGPAVEVFRGEIDLECLH